MRNISSCELKKTACRALQNPVATFTVGALCGLAIGMLCIPFSKGIVIGSYNGYRDNSNEEQNQTTAALDEKKSINKK